MHKLQNQRNSKRWVFTINNYTKADIKAVEEAACEFLAYGKELAPTTGTPHIQGYVEFSILRRTSTVCKILGGRAHCDPANGTAGENIEYCTKDKNYWMKDKKLEASYKFYDDHPLPEHWTKQERFEWKLMSNHENWTEEDLSLYLSEHEKHTNYLLSLYPNKTRTQLFKTNWHDEEDYIKSLNFYSYEINEDI